MTKEELAQWVINNRYPRSENEKVSDHEMFQFIIENLTIMLDNELNRGFDMSQLDSHF